MRNAISILFALLQIGSSKILILLEIPWSGSMNRICTSIMILIKSLFCFVLILFDLIWFDLALSQNSNTCAFPKAAGILVLV